MSDYTVTSLNKVVRGPKRATYDVETIHKILDDTFLCHIGYQWNEQVVVIPTAYGRSGETLYIHGSRKNRMLLALLENGKASVSVTHLDGLVLARSAFHHSANYRSATIFGNVREVVDINEKTKAMECLLNHMVPGHWDNIRQPNEKEFKSTLMLAIDIETAAAKIRAEGVIDEKEDHDLPIWAGIVPITQNMHTPIVDPLVPETISVPVSVQNIITK